ncbi:hypothetical protein C5614_00425 [Massilia phosphatilytica]|jgi:hypothetical protein|nr:hypothetical protein C5614_00425 [Massilia phosphatilytica]
MDNYDIEIFQQDIDLILVKNALCDEGMASEDEVDDLKLDLGRRLGQQVYACDGFNDYTLDRERLTELEVLGTVQAGSGFPKLLVEDPQNPDNEVEIPIIDPTEQL